MLATLFGGGSLRPSNVDLDFFRLLGGGKILLLNGDEEEEWCWLSEEMEGSWFIDVYSRNGGKAEEEER